ncbi:hypothetical protein BDK51DRAFT_35053, partial [Blyttiomyces helicus]
NEVSRPPSGVYDPGRRANRISIDKINSRVQGADRDYNIISNVKNGVVPLPSGAGAAGDESLLKENWIPKFRTHAKSPIAPGGESPHQTVYHTVLMKQFPIVPLPEARACKKFRPLPRDGSPEIFTSMFRRRSTILGAMRRAFTRPLSDARYDAFTALRSTRCDPSVLSPPSPSAHPLVFARTRKPPTAQAHCSKYTPSDVPLLSMSSDRPPVLLRCRVEFASLRARGEGGRIFSCGNHLFAIPSAGKGPRAPRKGAFTS